MLCVHSLDNEDILNNGHNFTICVYGTTCEKLILYLLYQSDSYIYLGEDCLEISRKLNAPI